MKRARLIIPAGLGVLVLGAAWSLRHHNFAVLNPAGTIAAQEKHLIVIVAALSLLIVIPVFVLLFTILWRYRESNKEAHYEPDLDGNKIAETIWWLIPSALIAVLAVMTWHTTHALDPYKPLASPAKPINVQVVALDWKWLFIYPDENIATTNLLKIPTDTPISFTITADAPMNSFWIPQLGGQIYAMPGMTSQLHLAADKVGDYGGRSANLSGVGFAGMTFTASAVTPSQYKAWVGGVKQSGNSLSQPIYDDLALPSENHPILYYGTVKRNLYDTIIGKYMEPASSATEATHGQAMNGMAM